MPVTLHYTLIYATKPRPIALGLVNDSSDAAGYVQQHLARAEMRFAGQQDAAAARGGQASGMAVLKWQSARWADVELSLDD